ncbi:hypothetical protein AVEN_204671-1 [Araneus ventricosus]|uniref:Tc1-like transposase DDE domain-containing protein n=1 Tax=Araneus ventricosus TaxID=182803 RepID=A0A4Y2EPQ4_ARAVE|nr:hypothetical protein AVEN_204671-1 [Araneus ventricosus]
MSIVHSDGLAQFQQDNATPHASRVATNWLQEHSFDFRHFHWPPKSPEMNIIEDIRDALLHAVEKRSPPPRTPMDLLTAQQDSWCEFPPGYLQIPVESMPRRFTSLLPARGGPDTILRRSPSFFFFFALQQRRSEARANRAITRGAKFRLAPKLERKVVRKKII